MDSGSFAIAPPDLTNIVVNGLEGANPGIQYDVGQVNSFPETVGGEPRRELDTIPFLSSPTFTLERTKVLLDFSLMVMGAPDALLDHTLSINDFFLFGDGMLGIEETLGLPAASICPSVSSSTTAHPPRSQHRWISPSRLGWSRWMSC